MQNYAEWTVIDDEDEGNELQDFSHLNSRRDVILFCIDCSPTMFEPYEHPVYENTQTSGVLAAFEAAVEVQKRKLITGPNDSFGILLFNTTRRPERQDGESGEIKRYTYVHQPIAPMSFETVKQLDILVQAARQDPDYLKTTFPPLVGKRVAPNDLFTTCNWVYRRGAPKAAATKRVFLISDCDNPLPPKANRDQCIITARTTLIDLVQLGIVVEPFFVNTEKRPFDLCKFYSHVLLPTTFEDDQEPDKRIEDSALPSSVSITRMDDLLTQMQFREVPKRAIFTVPFELAKGLTIGVKGYGLVTEQKQGAYKYFADLGNRMEPAMVRTTYVDEECQAEVERTRILYGSAGDDPRGVRIVRNGERPFYTAQEVKEFRTLGLKPGIKLLGFKDRDELRFEDNIKHSLFIYPNEAAFSGSTRTFTALLRSLSKKDKIGVVRVLTRINSTPAFCALVPQLENHNSAAAWIDPPGFHLIQLPFCDDIREAPIEEAEKASEELVGLAEKWVKKLMVKNGTYPADSYPNPALAYHNQQLRAAAFGEEWDMNTFDDQTLPAYDRIHKHAGSLIGTWKSAFEEEVISRESSLSPQKGMKRKASDSIEDCEVRARYTDGELHRLTKTQLTSYLRGRGESGLSKLNKDELVQKTIDCLEQGEAL